MRPFSLGLAGRMRSGRMPRRIHHFDNWLRPPAATEAKGGPLSVRGQAVKHPLKPRLDAGGGVAQGPARRMKRVVVGEGQRVAAFPLARGTSPLKSALHSVPERQWTKARGSGGTRRRWRPRTRWFRLRIFPAVLSAGQTSSGSRARSRSITFLGPKLWCASFVSMIRSTISGAVVSGWQPGLRERSSSPSGPWIR